MKPETEQLVAEHQEPAALAEMYKAHRDPLISLLACRLDEVSVELAGADEAFQEELDGLNEELGDAHNAEIAVYDEKVADLETLVKELQAEIMQLEKGKSDMSIDPKLFEILEVIGGSLARIADTLEGAAVPVADKPAEAEKPGKAAPKAVEKPAEEPQDEAPTISVDDVQGKMIDLVGLVGKAPAKAILEGFIPAGHKVVLGNVPEGQLPALDTAIDAALADAGQKAAA